MLNLVLPASMAGRTKASCVMGQPLGLAVVPDVYIIIAMSRILNRERSIPIVSSVTFSLIDSKVSIKGIAHITGGGFLENIPRILPEGLDINIQKKSFPILPVFSCIQSIGDLNEKEMYRTFNMGIGMAIVVDKKSVYDTKQLLNKHTTSYEIGEVVSGDKQVNLL